MSQVMCRYFATASGRMPAREFIDSLEIRSQQKFFAVKGLLEGFGYALREPHVKYLGQKIFELRFAGQEGAVRVLYFFVEGSKVIFTNGFLKKTEQTPEKEITFAIRSRAEYLRGQAGGFL